MVLWSEPLAGCAQAQCGRSECSWTLRACVHARLPCTRLPCCPFAITGDITPGLLACSCPSVQDGGRPAWMHETYGPAPVATARSGALASFPINWLGCLHLVPQGLSATPPARELKALAGACQWDVSRHTILVVRRQPPHQLARELEALAERAWDVTRHVPRHVLRSAERVPSCLLQRRKRRGCHHDAPSCPFRRGLHLLGSEGIDVDRQPGVGSRALDLLTVGEYCVRLAEGTSLVSSRATQQQQRAHGCARAQALAVR